MELSANLLLYILLTIECQLSSLLGSSFAIMAKSSSLCHYISQHRFSTSFGGSFFFLPLSMAVSTFLVIFLYIWITSSQVFTGLENNQYQESSPMSSLLQMIPFSFEKAADDMFYSSRSAPLSKWNQWSMTNPFGLYGNYDNNTEVYHDEDFFLEDYKEMNRSLKIFVYPHAKDDPFANVLLPGEDDPKGHYASELYFKKVLSESHFITKNPNEADLFFMPFSIVEMRHDPRIGPEGMQDFIKDYIFNISHQYPYWNRTDGADHFYVACHSIGRFAMDKVFSAKFNVIQVVCSSSYFVPGYIPHKDASMPQIWPRQGDPPNFASSKRKQLAFFAGTINSPARVALLQAWGNDTDIFAHFGRLRTPDANQLLRSKFCLHVKGFEVNTARIADAIYYGCVPVILANHYDLPFGDIINWESFSVVVHYMDIPVLKNILQRISLEEYYLLQSNTLKVRKHFQWNDPPSDFDAFYMTMYELWLRRSSVRVRLSASMV